MNRKVPLRKHSSTFLSHIPVHFFHSFPILSPSDPEKERQLLSVHLMPGF